MNKFEYGIAKCGEEGAELAQVVIKSAIHSDEFKPEDGNEFFEKLVEEFGDVMASVAWAYEHGTAHFQERVQARAGEKFLKYQKRFDTGLNV